MNPCLLSLCLPFTGVHKPWKKLMNDKVLAGPWCRCAFIGKSISVILAPGIERNTWQVSGDNISLGLADSMSFTFLHLHGVPRVLNMCLWCLLDQGTHLLSDRAKVSYEPERTHKTDWNLNLNIKCDWI